MEPFIGQIIMFGGNFAPRSWALCDGQLLPISQNSALFSILGTMYGGDGRTTFALPDMRGRAAIHAGSGPGLSTYRQGARGGQESVTLNYLQIPSHTHAAQIQNVTATTNATLTKGTGKGSGGDYIAPVATNFRANEGTEQVAGLNVTVDNLQGNVVIGNTGGSQAHTNLQPWCCINYIIALQGIFPSRS